MTEVATHPEVPLQVITPADVHASIGRARRSLEKAAEEIVWQIEMEAWRTLGYSSWKAMREAEYGGAAFMVPSKSRPEIVARIKEIEVGRTARGGPKRLTDQEIAETAGISRTQVKRDLGMDDKKVHMDQNVDSDDDVIDAEIVDDDEDDESFCTHCGATTDDCTCTQVQQKETDPAPAEPVTTITCPTCHGTGKVDQ